MPKDVFEAVHLQLAMAFGQGAHSMSASTEAISFAVSSQQDVIERARGNWDISKYAFTELVRVMGQIAAARAAAEGQPEIQVEHVKSAIKGVLAVCPCLVKTN